MSEEKDEKPLEDEYDEKTSPSAVVTNDVTHCPKCNRSFASSNYWGHSPRFDK